MRNVERYWLRIGAAMFLAASLTASPVYAASVVASGVDGVSSGPGGTAAAAQGSGPANTASGTEVKAAKPEESFNKELGIYEETFANGRRIVSTVPNGGQVADAVSIIVPQSSSVVMEIDGRKAAFQNGAMLTQQGFYVLLITDQEIGSNQKASAIMTFRILPPPAGKQDTGEYTTPKIISGLEQKKEITSGDMPLFMFPNRKGFFTDVPKDGAVVESAQFYFPPNVGYQLYRDGAPMGLYNNQPVTESGRYRLRAYAQNLSTDSAYAATYETSLNFEIPSNAEDAADTYSGYTVSGTGSGDGSLTYQGDSLTETYHEEYNLYEERFSNGSVFYTNIAEGSIVGGNVYIDIPSDIGVKLYRDGEKAAFISKEKINEEGTYRLLLTSQDRTGSDKTIYQADFHFRIQKGGALPGDAKAAAESGALEEIMPEETELEETLPEETVPEDNAEETEKEPEVTLTMPAPAGEGYRSEDKLFYYTFSDGSTLSVGAPKNGIANTDVMIIPPEGGRAMVSYGENSIEVDETVNANEKGSYHIEATSAGGETTTWDFRLLPKASNELTEITPPEGYRIQSVVYEDEPYEVTDPERFELPKDGLYTVSFTPVYEGYPDWFTAIIIDHTAPEVTFEGLDEQGKATGKEVTFHVNEEDAVIQLLRGKKEVKVSGNTISKGGRYTLTATDAAGNSSSYQFTIPNHMSGMTVGAVLFAAVLALGFIIYYKAYGSHVRSR